MALFDVRRGAAIRLQLGVNRTRQRPDRSVEDDPKLTSLNCQPLLPQNAERLSDRLVRCSRARVRSSFAIGKGLATEQVKPTALAVVCRWSDRPNVGFAIGFLLGPI